MWTSPSTQWDEVYTRLSTQRARSPQRGASSQIRNCNFTTRLSTRQARSPQRVHRSMQFFAFHHMFEHSTRTISAVTAATQDVFFTTRLGLRRALSLSKFLQGSRNSSAHHKFERSTCTILAEGHVSQALSGQAPG